MDDCTEPHWIRPALLLIDVQRDFTIPRAPALIPGTWEIVPAIQRLARAYRSANLPIIHVIRLYLADGSNVDLCRRARIEGGGKIVVPGTEGSQIVRTFHVISVFAGADGNWQKRPGMRLNLLTEPLIDI